ncbi:SDR family oxidoreductase [Actinomadura viridis]|uniref:3-oxoacyl-[acyl-carrier protein] reductase n=1 Tax=Actinomadura viridis TaxID=58110 RepID=A0A931DUS0_9ACTN|nr:SDR family oxidoreductase [Actinomadura viridis]MBG6093068.1 3-oxoacyl-[acyl-carrier protein] reductase [Actinomadura viridis]
MSGEQAGPLAGRTAIVTGASKGIGLGIARRLVHDGARVVITARGEDGLRRAVASLGADRVLGVAGRADDPDHQADAVARAIERFGGVDLLVNNAAVNPAYGPLLEVDLAAARRIVEVNVLAALAWTRQAYHAWMGEHGGAVVNVSSIAGLRPAKGLAMYGAGKAMLVHITQSLAVELAPRVRVNAVAPGIVTTEFATPLYAGREDEVAAAYPLRRLGEPDDIAGIVAFLLSGAAGWITGQLVVADGGVSLVAAE